MEAEDYNGEHLMNVAKQAADAAARYLASLDRSKITREYKGNDHHDIVTEHDQRAEEIIKQILLEEVPDAQIVGEESGLTEGGGRVVFYVDPIDGTTFFASGSPLYCVSIGVELDGKLLSGVVNAPSLGWEFKTDGENAWFNDAPIVPMPERQTHDQVALSYYPVLNDLNANEQITVDNVKALKREFTMNVVVGPAALQMCWVAMGWADLSYYNYISPWDVAAGMAIVHALGGHTDSFPQGHITDGRHHLATTLVTYRGKESNPVVTHAMSEAARLRIEFRK
ncbi:hypothetical protein BK816_02280 [Boudabousia tangfeifanii]|uniref:inositol-phosphate phosphatase n=1 Tax=Boudabousia tangfeifanii TaxID=1912795 RepID=A0A1D9MIV3_9ACTO|nr:inositol monophosphatase [Boudabousia tangfeifanii]AOZ72271.1 hypothetical protein BK816_02280 [Boudabousia tangfeifanii]